MSFRFPAPRDRIRRRLLQAHALITGAAALVLIARPAAIPATVGIELAPDAYLMSYLLAAAELGFAALSWMAAKSTDAFAVRSAMVACVVLHGASAVLEAIVWRSRGAPVLLANIAARLLIVGVFLWFVPRADAARHPSALPSDER
jgi:hypothetical protein